MHPAGGEIVIRPSGEMTIQPELEDGQIKRFCVIAPL
jgi:hypothetical protein